MASLCFLAPTVQAAADAPGAVGSSASGDAAVPDPPTNVVGSSGGEAVSVSWDPSVDNGSPVTSYTVTASPGGATATVSGTTAVVGGLTPGTAYTFTVVATNRIGDSAPSAPSEWVEPQGPPCAPILKAWRDDQSADINFYEPPSDSCPNSPGAQYYTVTAEPGDITQVWRGVGRFSGLTNGVAYTFTAVATNEWGDSPPSQPTDPVTPAGPPADPANVRVVAGDSTITVTWDPVSANGSATPVAYYVSSGSDSPSSWTKWTTTILTGLTNGRHYDLDFFARNDVGDSPVHYFLDVKPEGRPQAPTDVTAVPGDQSATVLWTAPPYNGSAVSAYSVTASPGGETMLVTDSGATFRGLTNGTAYSFSVVATNESGDSPPSVPSAAVTPSGPPDQPDQVTAAPRDRGAVVTWAAPRDNGSPVSSYTVTASPGGPTQTVTGTSATFTGLTNGTAYSFSVVATNQSGDSPSSATSSAVTPAGLPGPPERVRASAFHHAVIVTWRPAASNGSAITHYIIGLGDRALRTVTGTRQSIRVSHVPTGRYRVTVRSQNAVGHSATASPTSKLVVR